MTLPMKRVALLLFLLTGCNALPRDPDGTLDRVRATHRLRVGVPAGFGDADGKAAALIAAVAKQTGAKADMVRGVAEPLLVALDADRLDLVVAPFAAATPWAAKAALGPPLSIHGTGDDSIELRAAMRNGENRWIMLIEQASRDVAPEAAVQ